VNTAPRKDDLAARENNSGESLAYARLFNDIEIVAVNSGHSLSFIKDAATVISGIDVSHAGAQFRSRDVFPEPAIEIFRGNHTRLMDDWRRAVPDMPKDAVCYTDGYGNLKCSINAGALGEGPAEVTINGITQQVVRVGGIFGVKDGGFSFAAGSSGWTLPDGKTYKFAEVVKRGGSAAQAFGHPAGGSPVAWRAPS
jgi:hypothetical protein